jgi:hypothetical protein
MPSGAKTPKSNRLGVFGETLQNLDHLKKRVSYPEVSDAVRHRGGKVPPFP